jgi:hypothetical protein
MLFINKYDIFAVWDLLLLVITAAMALGVVGTGDPQHSLCGLSIQRHKSCELRPYAALLPLRSWSTTLYVKE